MKKEEPKPSQPFSISNAKVLVTRLINGILVRSRGTTLKRFEAAEGAGDAAGFDLMLCPVGVVVRDTKKKGNVHVVPWGNIEGVEIEDA